VGAWFGCGGRLIDFWVGTWGRGFRCGVSGVCFRFKNTSRGTIPCQCHFLQRKSRLEAMVGGALARASALRVGSGVGGATIVSGSCARPSESWMSCLLNSSLSLGISSLFCRATQCM
jgi:hypothetical protein